MRSLKILKLRKCNCQFMNVRRLATKSTWKPVVGLEIHAQISSESKLFSGASSNYGEPVNSCVSFFDCATPGTLPVLNRKCVEAGVLTALALSCKVNEVSLFDRKHYFYADLPSGYQITQQRQPLAIDGELKFNVFSSDTKIPSYTKVSKIKQIQLEQDSGKSLHDEKRGFLVDLNRAGVPLMELVFEPDLASGEEAAALVKELVITLERLNTCSCKMEEGALRVDANISIHKPNEPLGVRTEVKNIGSIRGVGGAIKYEIKRQMKILESGGKIVNETLSWDAEKQMTVSMRDKEEKQDYRFMPEPNLPPLRLHVDDRNDNKFNLVDVCSLKKAIPKLPEELRDNLRNNYGLSRQATCSIVNEQKLLQFFEEIMQENNARNPKTVTNVLLMELMEFVNKNKLELDNVSFSSKQIGEIVDLLQNQTINLATTKKVFNKLHENPEQMPKQIVEEERWSQINDPDELTKMCQAILDENPQWVTLYKSGKTKLLRAMLGAIVKKYEGRANMGKVVKIFEKLLE
ncbi:hypothetical protein HCN44_004387 [Aphidius gifuensis]|uniref:Glutamyl-tRNA(Gln) amidotransferase subunit B, mitochondrial n=1 Tax=Aphidius gifuensis TaxID=684658 RepID=A0A834XZI0_APHGI|nr:hypothetical protein HCN44_004387 [Aphidius gifuensis]